MRIVSSGEENQVGFILQADWHDNLVPGASVTAIARAGRQWNIDVEALTFSFPIFRIPTGAMRPEWILVERHEAHRRVLVEDLLSTITVMNIPIDYGYPLIT